MRVALRLAARRSPIAVVLVAAMVAASSCGPKPCPPDDLAACAKACDEGELQSCTTLGDADLKAKRHADAAKRYDATCAKGHAPACAALGRLHDFGEGVAVDDAKATSLYEKACGMNGVAGCASWAVHLQNGEGAPQDHVRAAAILDAACKKDDVESCWRLGVANRDGLGVIQDSKRARELLKAGCDKGASDACAHLQRVR